MPLPPGLLHQQYCVLCDRDHSVYIACARSRPKLKDSLAVDDGRRATAADLAMPAAPDTDPMLDVYTSVFNQINKMRAKLVADAAFGDKLEIKQPAPPVPDTDRMWDMVVLAARTSRYGE
jgi:hypothetical protein